MSQQLLTDMELSESYREESVRAPVLITLLVLVLAAAPLVWWIFRINEEGRKSTDISKYNVLVNVVADNVKTVDALLRNDAEELAAIRSAAKQPVVKLIVPDVVIVEEKQQRPDASKPLKVSIDGIYWSSANPLAGINGETYRVGDTIQGYEIVQIDKTSIRFQAADGTIVVMDIYDDLLQSEK